MLSLAKLVKRIVIASLRLKVSVLILEVSPPITMIKTARVGGETSVVMQEVGIWILRSSRRMTGMEN